VFCVLAILILLKCVDLHPKRHPLLTPVLPWGELCADTVHLGGDDEQVVRWGRLTSSPHGGMYPSLHFPAVPSPSGQGPPCPHPSTSVPLLCLTRYVLVIAPGYWRLPSPRDFSFGKSYRVEYRDSSTAPNILVPITPFFFGGTGV
jgi:hypothetical protein